MQNNPRLFAGMLVALSVVAGCARKDIGAKEDSAETTAVAAPADRSADEAAIRQGDDQYFNGVKAKDAAMIAGTYAADAVSNPPNSPPLKGSDAIRKYNEEFLKLPQVTMTGGLTMLKFSDDGTMAYELGTYALSYADPKGRIVKDEGKYMNVWGKVDGKWKVVADAFSSNAPPPK